MEYTNTKPLRGGGCLTRLYWMFGGNAILLFVTVFIVDKHFKFPSLLDLAYWATVISLLVVRYIDVRFMNGDTAEGKPSTLQDFRRYAFTLTIVAALLYILICFLR